MTADADHTYHWNLLISQYCTKALAEADGRGTFIGRRGTCQYPDMHQVINRSLAAVRRWLARNG